MSVLISRAFAEVDDKVGPLPAKRQAERLSKANGCNRNVTQIVRNGMLVGACGAKCLLVFFTAFE